MGYHQLVNAESQGRGIRRTNEGHVRKHGFKEETEAGITMKLKRGTFSATFFLACLAALELEGVVLEEILRADCNGAGSIWIVLCRRRACAANTSPNQP